MIDRRHIPESRSAAGAGPDKFWEIDLPEWGGFLTFRAGVKRPVLVIYRSYSKIFVIAKSYCRYGLDLFLLTLHKKKPDKRPDCVTKGFFCHHVFPH